MDIAIEDYVNKALSEEKRNTNIFFGVTEEALKELQLAYSNADGWLLDDLPEGYKELTLGMVNEFLTQPKEVLESVQGSYELVSNVSLHKRLHSEEPFNEEIRILYENIPWKAIKSRFAVESVYLGMCHAVREAISYFETVGSLIYKDIPNFLNYLENGDEVSGSVFEQISQARHAKFMRKYYETLEFLRSLAEG